MSWTDVASVLFLLILIAWAAIRLRPIPDRRARIFFGFFVILLLSSAATHLVNVHGLMPSLNWFGECVEDLLLPAFLIGFLYLWALRERDVQRQREESLRESARRFRELAEMLPEIVFELDTQGKVVFANHTAFERTGFTPADLERGFTPFDFLVPEDHARAREHIRLSMAGRKTEGTEYTAVTRTGKRFPVLVVSRPLHRDGSLEGLRGIVVDLTNVKQAQDKLLHVRKLEAVGTLAAGIAHDFNNIIQGISGNVELLSYGSLDEKQRMIVERIGNGCDRAAGLVSRLLSFSRREPLRLRPIDVNEEIRNFLNSTQLLLPPAITVRTDLAPGLWTVKADTLQWERVLFHLSKNAAEAMKGTGTIRIQTENWTPAPKDRRTAEDGADLYVRIHVSDTGPGIAPELAGQIFDPFVTTKEGGTGAGLGLAVVHGIVRSHGGRIDCTSSPGAGTTFTVVLPAFPDRLLKVRAFRAISLPGNKLHDPPHLEVRQTEAARAHRFRQRTGVGEGIDPGEVGVHHQRAQPRGAHPLGLPERLLEGIPLLHADVGPPVGEQDEERRAAGIAPFLPRHRLQGLRQRQRQGRLPPVGSDWSLRWASSTLVVKGRTFFASVPRKAIIPTRSRFW